MYQFHPCDCKATNNDQCYNCMNGAHDICEGPEYGFPKCEKKRAKQVGVMLVFKESRKKKK